MGGGARRVGYSRERSESSMVAHCSYRITHYTILWHHMMGGARIRGVLIIGRVVSHYGARAQYCIIPTLGITVWSGARVVGRAREFA